jgi:glucosamine kinase
MAATPPPRSVEPRPAPQRPGLGLDVGGTHTRWALADASGQVLAEGLAPGWTALALADTAARTSVAATLAGVLADARHAAGVWPPACVVAGITGYDASQASTLAEVLAAAWHTAQGPQAADRLPPPALQACNDIELLCLSAFGPGEAGGVVYAGTGSVAAWLDAAGTLHRAGGRGGLIDDAGGGHWIARQALACVWRAEDAAPGCTALWPLAQALATPIGGADWAAHRRWVYGASRGELGRLALAVAAAAPADPRARRILAEAGLELARLARALLQRHAAAEGARSIAGAAGGNTLQAASPGTPWPLALAGRAFDLHPLIETTLRAALPPDQPLRRVPAGVERTAARLAAARQTHPG